MSPETFEIIKIIMGIVSAALTSGGIVFAIVENRSRSKLNEQEHAHELKLKDKEFEMKAKENEFNLRLKELEQESERNKTELARLRADSDRDMMQSEDRRQWISLVKEQGQGIITLSASIEKLAENVKTDSNRNTDTMSKFNNMFTTLTVSINELPKNIANQWNAAMREANRNDMRLVIGEHEEKAKARFEEGQTQSIKMLEKLSYNDERITRIEKHLHLDPIQEGA